MYYNATESAKPMTVVRFKLSINFAYLSNASPMFEYIPCLERAEEYI